MATWTRRDLLRLALLAASSSAAAPLLTACTQPAGPGSPAASPPSPTPFGTPGQGLVAATPIPVAPPPTRGVATPVYRGGDGDLCRDSGYRPSPQPGDPYLGGGIGERKAYSFAAKVKMPWACIVVATVRDILPARWATADGRRPDNPHGARSMLIFTPVRVEVDRVATGAYSLPDLYFAAPGGRIGQDCAAYSGSGAWPTFRFGERFLYFVSEDAGLAVSPVPGDSRYRYYSADYSYAVTPDGTLTIGPEYDIMGGRADDPPRTLTLDEAQREIAALLATPSATPTR
jgi:hypothetical protein